LKIENGMLDVVAPQEAG